VVVPPRPQFNPLLADVAAALGIGLSSGFKFGEALRQIKIETRLQKVKMMIFDEVQHITEGSISSYQAADVFKIIAKCGVQVVCVGMPSMMNLVEGKNANTQLKRLKQKRCDLSPLACSLDDFLGLDSKATDPKDIRFVDTPYKEFCSALDNRSDPANIVLPFDSSSDISNPMTAIRLWRATDGFVGRIMDFLHAASDLAIEKGMPKIAQSVMIAAYRESGKNDSENWFKMPLPEVVKRFERAKPEEDADRDEKAAAPARRSQPLRKKK
jgi:hypothetical protein